VGGLPDLVAGSLMILAGLNIPYASSPSQILVGDQKRKKKKDGAYMEIFILGRNDFG